MEQSIGLSYQEVEYSRRKTDHQRLKVVPERVVLVGHQVALVKTVQMTGLTWVALEEAQMLLGHHDNGWWSNQPTMGPTPQQLVEAAKAHQKVETDHVEVSVTTGQRTPPLGWDQKNVGHLP